MQVKSLLEVNKLEATTKEKKKAANRRNVLCELLLHEQWQYCKSIEPVGDAGKKKARGAVREKVLG